MIRRVIALLPVLAMVVISVSAAWAAGAPDPDRQSGQPAGQEAAGSDPPASAGAESSGDQSGQDAGNQGGDQSDGDQPPNSGDNGSSDQPPADGTGQTPPDGSGQTPPDGTGEKTVSTDEPAPAEPTLPPPTKRERRVPDHYIVVYKDSVGDPAAETRKHEKAEGFKSDLRYTKAIKGFAAKLSGPQVAKLQADPEVAFVTPDAKVKATDSVPLASGEPLPPTGVRRIQAASSTSAHEASDVGVAVIDTGIDLNHSDLNAVDGTNCFDPTQKAQDGDGHGTHVAGTIAAKNNGAGVVGVAPGTKVYAVKVLDDNGDGTFSSVICGIDWVTANASALGIKVANMSLGGFGPELDSCPNSTDAMHKAICKSTAAGVTYVVAAGNSGWDFDLASSPDTPAAYPEVLTVTAASDSDGLPGGSGGDPTCRKGESDDKYASFSNFAKTSAGRDHTIAAPGICIRSTWKGGGYNTISGTSMASPHIAGAVALCLDDGGTNGPCAGKSPSQIVQQVRSDAKDHTDGDHGYGFTGDPDNNPVSGEYFGYLGWVGVTGSGSSSDTTAPTVSSVSPADNATGVSVSTNVSVTFSEPMDHASAEGAFSLKRSSDGSPVSGSFSWSGNTMTFDPTNDLAAGIGYDAKLTTGAQDLAGNPLSAQESWSFTTAAPLETTAPTIKSISPVANATGVAVSTNVSVTFSEPMNQSQTQSAFSLRRTSDGSSVSGTFSWSGNTMTFDPTSDLASTKYTATVTTAARDLAGNPLGSQKLWYFTTDVTRPTVKSISPGGGATGVQGFANATVTFSEPMDHASAQGAFSLKRTSDGSSVSGAFSWSGNTMTFDPTGDLDRSTGYTATVGTGARDLNGNSLATQKLWTFTTWNRTSPLPGAVTVLEGSPAGGNQTALEDDDDQFLSVASTGAATFSAAWRVTFTGVPNSLTALRVIYKGKNSATCAQTVSIWNDATSAWVQLSSTSVGATEVKVDKAPGGTLANYVSGSAGDGDLVVRVRCTSSSAGFTSMGDLLRIGYL
ncbi:MAG: Ig-like domain-containing protein [Solirubrobacteraceae bacterium]